MKHTPINASKNSERRMTIALALVVAAAVVIAFATARTSHGADVRADDLSPQSPLAVESASPPAPADGALGGVVLEALPVSKYTYLRLRTSDGETWAAVPTAVVTIGSQVSIANATRMDDFKSATLGRTFTVIYFGTLAAPGGEDTALKFPVGDEGVEADDQLPPGHPDISANSAPSVAGNSDTLPPGHPDLGAPAAAGPSPHGGADMPRAASDPLLPMPKIARALGSNGHVIAELAAERQQLAGQRVRVRGQVTKVTPDVQGRSFFHLRDGTLSGKGLPADLAVMSAVEPKRGQVATFEGTLRADDDIGIGYQYPVLLEDATVVSD